MIELRDYQEKISTDAVKKLRKYGICTLWMEVRTGKTLTALAAAEKYGARSVLFVTRKKAIPSIEDDYDLLDPEFKIVVINYESVHKFADGLYDFIICDESHGMGAFPKPSLRAKRMKKIVGDKPLILMSGTPTPESFSQIYHQLWISHNSPFREYPTFYRWARKYVNIYERYINGRNMRFYDRAKRDEINEKIQHLEISYTQTEAGFQSMVEEKIVWLDMPGNVQQFFHMMDKHQVIIDEGLAVPASNAADVLNKLSQVSGCTLLVDGEGMVLSDHKAKEIRKRFQGKFAIFYKYRTELEVLKSVFTSHTESPEEFNDSDIEVFLGQVQSVREGVNLRSADAIVFYNIDFSATSYEQARARLQYKDRKDPAMIYWMFYKQGIEKYVYDAVKKKKNFTSFYYRNNF